jgi:hypothetical protein
LNRAYVYNLFPPQRAAERLSAREKFGRIEVGGERIVRMAAK